MRFQLTTQALHQPILKNDAPLVLQDSSTWKILALPYQKYTFSEWKIHEELFYGNLFVGNAWDHKNTPFFNFEFAHKTVWIQKAYQNL